MGDANPIRTLGDYSKPSHEGYRNTIELPVGNNVVPLRSDTIRLVQNGCSFHGLRSEDPNQHLKDFLKLVDSLDLDGENRERTRLRRTAKLRNDILMFQQHHGESLSEAWTHFKDLLQKVPHHGIDRWLQIQIFYDHVSFHLKCEIDRAVGGKIHNKNPDESWEIIENLALYNHEGGNDAKEFVKPVKAISTPQPTSKMPDQRLLELEDQINFLLKGSRPTPRPSSTQVPQAYAEAVYSNPRPRNRNELLKQIPFTFSEYNDTEEEDDSSTNACNLNLGGMVKGKEEVKEKGKEEDEMETDMEVEKVIKEEESEFKTDEEVEEIFEEEEKDEDDENFNSFPTMKELSHHEWLLKNPRPPWVKAKVRARSMNNIKISCMVGELDAWLTLCALESKQYKITFQTIFRGRSLASCAKVVKLIHEDYGGIDNLGSINRSSTWLECLKSVDQLKKKGVDLMSFVHKEVGDGKDTLFWLDPWLEDGPFKCKFPRVYALDENKHVSVSDKLNIGLSACLRRLTRGKSDTWIWSLEASGLFSVASARRYIDDILCAWEGAPTRHNISLRGIDIQSFLCLICAVNVEHENHLFFSCMIARKIYERIFKWCGLLVVMFSSYNDWLAWFASLKIRKDYESTNGAPKEDDDHKTNKFRQLLTVNPRVWVISPAWLKESFRARLFVDIEYESKYMHDVKGAVLRERAKPIALFKGFEVCLAPHMQPLSCIVRLEDGNIRRLNIVIQ
ncbi:hypothetical protein Tco_0501002 [Tanacetum coccineum]